MHDVKARNIIAALAVLAGFATPTIAQETSATIAPSRLLTQRQELDLTPHQVKELTILAAQVQRYQQAVLRAPSKPWIANARGTTREVASARARALLTPQQRALLD